jgi:hypothetical protein
MKARLITSMFGAEMREIGDEVDGEEAIRLVRAGFAVPLAEKEPAKETRASGSKKPASNKVTSKETR